MAGVQRGKGECGIGARGGHPLYPSGCANEMATLEYWNSVLLVASQLKNDHPAADKYFLSISYHRDAAWPEQG